MLVVSSPGRHQTYSELRGGSTSPSWPSGLVHPIRNNPWGWCASLKHIRCPIQHKVFVCLLLCTSGMCWEGCLGDMWCFPWLWCLPWPIPRVLDLCAAVNAWIKGFELQGCAHVGAPGDDPGADTRGVAGDGVAFQCPYHSAG